MKELRLGAESSKLPGTSHPLGSDKAGGNNPSIADMSSEVEPLAHSCPNCAALLDVSEQEPFSEVHCPSCGTKMRVRTRFDHFELLELIASGGMGTVYKARDVNLNRIVALKLLRKEFSIDQEYIEKLETEAKITASVSHPHVVKVFSFGCDRGIYYIAMELVDKGSLDDLMSLQGKIAEVQVLEIGIQAAQGLRAAFEVGLIHRDVKPGNILFADAHTAKIVDFGLAMPLEQAQDAEEEIWGTPYYVAPEKLNHEPEDLRSDIYSLGGTLFHALAGRPPFEADNASLVALKHLKSQAVSLQTFAPDISSPTSYVINRTLAKNPDDRYQSYDELIEHLEYARTKLLENTFNPRQPKARVVVEGEEQQTILGYVMMGVIGILVLAGILFFVFREKIATHGLTPEERERRRIMRVSVSTDEGYRSARRLIADGQAQNAVPLLWNLGRRGNVEEPLKSWILLHSGIASYITHLKTGAAEAFTELGERPIFSTQPADERLANFFPEVARMVAREAPLREDIIADYETTEFEPLGLFVYGLKEWENGRFEISEKLFQAFLASTPQGQWEWISQYKPIAQRYVDDYQLVKDLGDEVQKAETIDDMSALLYRMEEVRMNLKISGKLIDRITSHEKALQKKIREKAPGDREGDANLPRFPNQFPGRPHGKGQVIAIGVLRDSALQLVREFQPEEAVKILENAIVSPMEEEARGLLLRRVNYMAMFKKQLIEDINAKGYSGPPPLNRKAGGAISGKIVQASPYRLEVSGPNNAGSSVLWTDLTAESIDRLASSFITTRGGEPPDDADANRLWCLGVYNILTTNRKEALPHLMRAAEVRQDYARDLTLFDDLSR